MVFDTKFLAPFWAKHQVHAPLLTSAIDWLPYTLLVPEEPTAEPTAGGISYFKNTREAAPKVSWDAYLVIPSLRQRVIIGALQYVNMLTFGPEALKADYFRHINTANKYTTAAQVDYVAYPCIELGDIDWIKIESELKQIVTRLTLGKISNSTERWIEPRDSLTERRYWKVLFGH